MTGTIVHKLHDEFTALVSALNEAAEPSLCVTANDCFRKALLMAAASHFETHVTRIVIEYVRVVTDENPLILEFLQNKGLKRQYHTLFNWDGNNANTFFSLFGSDFKKFAEQRVKEDRGFDEAVRAFLTLGEARNRLIHQDFGNFVLEKTADEIFGAFQLAEYFVEVLPTLLRDCPTRV